MEKPIVLFGLPIPDSSPLFLTILAIHVAAGLICVISGAFAMMAPKIHGSHDKYGKVYYWGLCIVFITALILSVIRWPYNNHLLALGSLSFAAAYFGRRARRMLWHRWPLWHLIGMGSSYILMLTAFYVDNGKNLPLWNRLPAIAFWLLPSLIGIPLMVFAWIRNPLMRSRG